MICLFIIGFLAGFTVGVIATAYMISRVEVVDIDDYDIMHGDE